MAGSRSCNRRTRGAGRLCFEIDCKRCEMWAFNLIYLVATTLLTIALAPRPPAPASASITDFKLPTADQGKPIPVIFGTVDITGANCVWDGDLSTSQIKVKSLFSSTITGYQYFL